MKAALDAAITRVPRLLIADWITRLAILKYGTLDSGRKSDPQDLQETGSVNG